MGDTERASSFIPGLHHAHSCVPGATTTGRGNGARQLPAVDADRAADVLDLNLQVRQPGPQRLDGALGFVAALLGGVGRLVQEALEVRQRRHVLAQRAVGLAAVEQDLRARDQAERLIELL